MTTGQLLTDATKEVIAQAYERGWRDACDNLGDAVLIKIHTFLDRSSAIRSGRAP